MNSVGLFFAVICVITVAVYCKPAPDPPNSVLVGEAFLTVDGQDTLYQYTLYPPAGMLRFPTTTCVSRLPYLCA